jgi:hypothetical protein
MQYRRDGATASGAITDSDIALNDAHTDGGWEEIGAGYYRFDLPDAACAVGVDGVQVFGGPRPRTSRRARSWRDGPAQAGAPRHQ